MIFCVLHELSERREGLKALLRQVNRQATALDARDWRQAELVMARANPDLLVIDWQSPPMQTHDLALFLHAHPKLPAAVLVDDAQADAVAAFMHAGVLGVIPRDLAPRLIVRAFELVLLGGHYVPARALDIGLPDTPAYPPRNLEVGTGGAMLPRRRNLDGPSPLSPRQHQIMRLVHLGNTNKIIARALGISEGTVKIHLSSIFRLLGATNRAAAVAIYNGWQFNDLNVLRSASPALAPPCPVPAGKPVNDPVPWLLAAEPQTRYRVKKSTCPAPDILSTAMLEPLPATVSDTLARPALSEKN